MTLSTPELRVLVVDGEPSILDDYRLILASAAGDALTALSRLEADLFGPTSAPRQLPRARLTACDHGEAATAAVLQAARSAQPFAVAFVDPQVAPGHSGLELVSRLRALDPYLFIVAVTASAELHPVNIAEQVPPVDRLFFLRKPFYGPEIQQFVNALGARWRSERLSQESTLVAQQIASRWPTDVEAMLEEMPAGVAVFDRGDYLIGCNRVLRDIYPATGSFEPGANYEEVLRAMARDALIPQLSDVNAWVRSRLEWHASGTGAIEQRLKNDRCVLLLERRAPDGRCICLHADVTAWQREHAAIAATSVLRELRR